MDAVEINNKFKQEVIKDRIQVLKAMDEAIRGMNDESVFEPWLMLGVPDEAFEEDYEDIASDHKEYIRIVKLYAKLTERYGKEDF